MLYMEILRESLVWKINKIKSIRNFISFLLLYWKIYVVKFNLGIEYSSYLLGVKVGAVFEREYTLKREYLKLLRARC